MYGTSVFAAWGVSNLEQDDARPGLDMLYQTCLSLTW